MGRATSFEMSLSSPFSEAREIGELMLSQDPRDVGGISQNGSEPKWPPLVTPVDLVARLDVYSDRGGDFPDPTDKHVHEKVVASKLATWANEGFFEIVALPMRDKDYVAFRITQTGAQAVKRSVDLRIEALRDVRTRATNVTAQRKR